MYLPGSLLEAKHGDIYLCFSSSRHAVVSTANGIRPRARQICICKMHDRLSVLVVSDTGCVHTRFLACSRASTSPPGSPESKPLPHFLPFPPTLPQGVPRPWAIATA